MSSAAYQSFLQALRPVHARGVRMGLERMREALQTLDLAPPVFPCVQVAGTNGKGSTVAMVESICRAAGLRTGMFTSPHLSRFTERIRIDGTEIDEGEAVDSFERVRATGVELTYFEVTCLMALVVMRQRRVDVGVLETGLGGRLDAVTAVEVCATAITSIGLDHVEILGPTLAHVTGEKAAIARPGVPMVVGILPPAVRAVVDACARNVSAPVQDAPPLAPDTVLALAGVHQRQNAAVAVALAKILLQQHARTLASGDVQQGLRSVTWPGRFEWALAEGPSVLLDCAHNPDGVHAFACALSSLPADRRPRVAVLSIMAEKNFEAILQELIPAFAHLVLTRAPNPRALAPATLHASAVALGARSARAVDDPVAALAAARAIAAEGNGTVAVTGSVFLVGVLRAHLMGERSDEVPLWDPSAKT